MKNLNLLFDYVGHYLSFLELTTTTTVDLILFKLLVCFNFDWWSLKLDVVLFLFSKGDE